MSNHTEFRFSVTVYSLESPHDRPCNELVSVCRIIGAMPPDRSPAELFPCQTPLLLVSTHDATCYVSIDVHRQDPEMGVVQIRVRCNNEVADHVEHELRQIRARSEVKTAFLRYPAI